MEKYYYLFLLLVSTVIPLIRSFEQRVRFREKWPALFAGILVMMGIFIPWDILFAHHGIWSFNHLYVIGLYLFGLPVEEWLFFIVIPYCIVFTYEVFRYFLPRLQFRQTALIVSLVAGIALIVMAILNSHRLYTFIVTLLTGTLLLMQPFFSSHKKWLSHFFLTYVVMLIPFLVVNGALTGMFTEMPVVSYDDVHNLGIRIFTIPVEDAVYLLGMMFVVQMVYERRIARRGV